MRRKWYSMSKEKVKEQTAKDPAVENQQEEETLVDKQEETVEQPKELTIEEKLDEANNKYLRLYSDFENFRKRNAKERIELIGNASAGLMKDLLPVIDDLERAIVNNENNEDIASVKEGFKLINDKFNHILVQKGLKNMDSVGTPFNTDLHEAITNIPAPTEDLKGKVVDVAEKGYYLNDKVLRFAKVIVGQ
jgi:molecular chaperone GrpE